MTKKIRIGGRLFAFLLPCFIFLTLLGAWNLSSNLGLRANKLLFSQLVAIAFIGLFFLKNWWLKAFLLWTVIRTAMLCCSASYTTLAVLFIFLMTYQVLSDRIKPFHINLILNSICVVILIQTIWMIANYFGIWFLTIPTGIKANIIPNYLHIDLGFKSATTGLLTHHNMASALLALSLPAFFRKKWCWFIPLVWCGLLIGKSAGGVVPAVVITVLFLFFRFKKHRLKIAFLSLIGVILFIFRPFGLDKFLGCSGRTGMWKLMIQHIIPKKPIVGIGVGQFKDFFPKFYLFISENMNFKEHFSTAHNEYLQLWIEQGIIGLGLAMGFIGSLFHKIPKTPVAGLAALGIIAGLINCGVNFLFHTTEVMLLLIWIIILEKEKEKRRIL